MLVKKGVYFVSKESLSKYYLEICFLWFSNEGSKIGAQKSKEVLWILPFKIQEGKTHKFRKS
jgi:hypothetical protein